MSTPASSADSTSKSCSRCPIRPWPSAPPAAAGCARCSLPLGSFSRARGSTGPTPAASPRPPPRTAPPPGPPRRRRPPPGASPARPRRTRAIPPPGRTPRPAPSQRPSLLRRAPDRWVFPRPTSGCSAAPASIRSSTGCASTRSTRPTGRPPTGSPSARSTAAPSHSCRATAGSLQSEAAPGHFVICDQLVDRTSGRADTFYDGPVTTHVAFADPYCPELRGLALKQAQGLGITAHDGGTMVVVQGPRFSTRAESRWYQEAGWKVINMTGYPEALLARELEICYVNVSLITDYDVGLEGASGVEPVSHAEVVRVFEQNNAKLRDLLVALIPSIPTDRSCICSTALAGARFEV